MLEVEMEVETSLMTEKEWLLVVTLFVNEKREPPGERVLYEVVDTTGDAKKCARKGSVKALRAKRYPRDRPEVSERA